jgi:hypothetical protein
MKKRKLRMISYAAIVLQIFVLAVAPSWNGVHASPLGAADFCSVHGTKPKLPAGSPGQSDHRARTHQNCSDCCGGAPAAISVPLAAHWSPPDLAVAPIDDGAAIVHAGPSLVLPPSRGPPALS